MTNSYSISKNSKLIMYIIDFLCLFYLLVDTFAGILVRNGSVNIGQLYKMFLIFLMSIVVLDNKKNASLMISFFLCTIFTIPLFSAANSFSSVSQSMLVIFKIESIFIFYLYFTLPQNYKRIKNIILFNYFIFLINMIAGIAGLAPAMRVSGEEQIGTRGFFFAGNEVSYTFICLSFFMLNSVHRRKLLLYAITLAISVIVATKACIISAVFLIFFDFYFSLKKQKRMFFIVAAVTLIALITVYIFNHYKEISLLNYIAFKFEQHKTGTYPILNALLSGRVSRLDYVTMQYNSSPIFLRLFFGIGFPNTATRLEMDLKYFIISELYFCLYASFFIFIC